MPSFHSPGILTHCHPWAQVAEQGSPAPPPPPARLPHQTPAEAVPPLQRSCFPPQPWTVGPIAPPGGLRDLPRAARVSGHQAEGLTSPSSEVGAHPLLKVKCPFQKPKSETKVTTLKPMTLRDSARPQTNGDFEADGLGGHSGINHGGLEEHTKKQKIFTGCQGVLGKVGQAESAPTLPGCSLDYAWPQCPQEETKA